MKKLLICGLTFALFTSKLLADDFFYAGNFESMINTGDVSGKIKLSQLKQKSGYWGLGALAGLNGEIIQINGKLLVSYGNKTNVTNSFGTNESATLWMSEKVSKWQNIKITKNMDSEQFEQFVEQSALKNKIDLNKPFAFRVTGKYRNLSWHIVSGVHHHKTINTSEEEHSNHMANLRVFDQANASGELIGFYSGDKLAGVISHVDEKYHLHYINESETISGHVDDYSIESGSILWLPAK